MMVRSAVMANEESQKILDELRIIPKEQRINDERIINIVRNFKIKWERGTKIEKLATLGWNESEVINLFSEMLDQLDFLRTQYQSEVDRCGNPSEISDENLERYEVVSKKINKKE